jgi:hypothetical protein
MFTLRIEHQIHGFEMWKGAFDRLPALRERAGVRNHRIFRPVDDPNYVMIDLDFDSVDAAEAFLAVLHRDVWRSSETAPALVGRPQTRIVEVAESKGY